MHLKKRPERSLISKYSTLHYVSLCFLCYIDLHYSALNFKTAALFRQ